MKRLPAPSIFSASLQHASAKNGAAASGSVKIIPLLLKHGVDPATVSQTSDTALSIARQRGDAAVISSFEKSFDIP